MCCWSVFSVTDEALIMFVASNISFLSVCSSCFFVCWNSLGHLCPNEAPRALDMIDRCEIRKVVAEESGRILFQFFSRPIMRETIVSPPKTDTLGMSEKEGDAAAAMVDDIEQQQQTDSVDDATLSQIFARGEEKAVVPLEEYELPSVEALCFGYESCTCSNHNKDSPCVCYQCHHISFHHDLLID